MKNLPIALLSVSLAFSSVSHAQTPAPNPAATPATPIKPKALSSSDRAVATDILENVYLIGNLAQRVRNLRTTQPNLFPEEGWKAVEMAEKLQKEFWGLVAPLSILSGDKLPEDVTAKDKKKLATLPSTASVPDPKKTRSKKGDFATEWAKLMTEQTKDLTKLIEKAGKSMDPQMSQLKTKQADAVKTLSSQFEKMASPAK
jgi:hypothetical protein